MSLGHHYVKAFRLSPAVSARCKVVVAREVPPSGSDVELLISQALDEEEPPVLVHFSGARYASSGLTELDVPKALICTDWRADFRLHAELSRLFELVVVEDKRAADAFRSVAADTVVIHPCTGYDPEVSHPIQILKAYDVTFVGMLEPGKRRSREWAAETLVAMSQRGIRVNLLQGVVGRDAARAYNRSRLVVFGAEFDGIESAVVEALACGRAVLVPRGFLAAKPWPLEAGKHVIEYEPETLEEVLEDYLTHSEKRDTIAQAAREVAEQTFSYESRALALLDLLEQNAAPAAERPGTESSGIDERLLAQGIALHYQGNSDAAADVFRQLDRSAATAWNNLGVTLASAERFPEAAAAICNAVEEGEHDRLTAFNAGMIHLRAGKLGRARRWFEKVLESKMPASVSPSVLVLEPDYRTKLACEVAACLGAMGDADQAGATLGRVLEFESCRALCEIAMRQERYGDARNAAQRVVSLVDEDCSAWLDLGRACARAGDIDSAEEAYRKAILSEPMCTEAQQELIALLSGENRSEDTAAVWEASLCTNPLFAMADRARSWRELGDLSKKMNRDVDTFRHWLRSLLLDAEQPELEAMLTRMVQVDRERNIVKVGAAELARPTVSLLMIVKNEEDILPECLRAMKPLMDEIVILDTGSTDRTPEIARESGAQVRFYEWQDDFAAARNESLKHARCDWVLILDADEVVSTRDFPFLAAIMACGDYDAIELVQATYVQSTHMLNLIPVRDELEEARGCPGYVPSPLVRAWRRDAGYYFEHRVHETANGSVIRSRGRIASLPVLIHHYGKLVSEKRLDQKAQLYLKLGQLKISDDPEDAKAAAELGRQLKDLGHYDEALDAFRKSLALSPYLVMGVEGLVEMAFIKGTYREAAEALASLERDRISFSDDLAVNFAALQLKHGNVGQAAERLEGVLNANTDKPLAWLHLAKAYEYLNRVDAARDAYRRALDLEPGWKAAHVRLRSLDSRIEAAELAERGETAAAIDSLKSAAKQNPANDLLLNDLAAVLAVSGYPEQSAKLLSRVLKLSPWLESAAANAKAVEKMLHGTTESDTEGEVT